MHVARTVFRNAVGRCHLTLTRIPWLRSSETPGSKCVEVYVCVLGIAGPERHVTEETR